MAASDVVVRCDEIRGMLSEHLDGMLSPEAERQVQAHVAGCAACAEELAALRRMVAALRALPRAGAPPELGRRVRDAVERDRNAPVVIRVARWAFPEGQGRVLATAATLTGLAILVGVGVTRHGPEGPPRPSAARQEKAAAADAAPAASAPAHAAPAQAAPAKDSLERAEVAATPAPLAKKSLAGEKLRADEPAPVATPSALPAPALGGRLPEPPREERERDLDEAPPAEGSRAPRDAMERRFDQERASGSDDRAKGDVAAVPPWSPPPRTAADKVEDPAAGLKRKQAKEEAWKEPAPARPAPPPATGYAPVPPEALGAAAASEVSDEGVAGGVLAPGPSAAPEPEAEPSLREERQAPGRLAEESTVAGAATGAVEGKDRSRAGTLLQVDASTGWFRRAADAPRKPKSASAPGAELFASLELLASSDASGPLMRLTFPTDGWAEGLGTAPAAPGPAAASSGSLDYSLEVTGKRCDPGSPGGPGSDARPLRVGDDVDAPTLVEGQAPAVGASLAGSSATFDLVVRRDGTVARVDVVTNGSVASGKNPGVLWALYRWRFHPAQCDGAAVAAVFRVEVRWIRPGR